MWITARCPTLFPATVTAILGRVSRLYREPKPDSLAHLDDHLLRDIGVERSTVLAPGPLSTSQSDSRENRVEATLGRPDMTFHQHSRRGFCRISSLPSAVRRR